MNSPFLVLDYLVKLFHSEGQFDFRSWLEVSSAPWSEDSIAKAVSKAIVKVNSGMAKMMLSRSLLCLKLTDC